jgi:hypothetical protein
MMHIFVTLAAWNPARILWNPVRTDGAFSRAYSSILRLRSGPIVATVQNKCWNIKKGQKAVAIACAQTYIYGLGKGAVVRHQQVDSQVPAARLIWPVCCAGMRRPLSIPGKPPPLPLPDCAVYRPSFQKPICNIQPILSFTNTFQRSSHIYFTAIQKLLF